MIFAERNYGSKKKKTVEIFLKLKDLEKCFLKREERWKDSKKVGKRKNTPRDNFLLT